MMLLTCLGTKVRQVEKKLYADAVPVADYNYKSQLQKCAYHISNVQTFTILHFDDLYKS